jgi:hypothetical protein
VDRELVHRQFAVVLVPRARPDRWLRRHLHLWTADPGYKGRTLLDVLEAMDKLGKPSIFCFQQKFPAGISDKVGLSGGNMTSAMRACGAIGALSNGPSRDIQEIRPMNFQYLTRGICAGHGTQTVHAVQVPVSIAGMDIAPGEIVHMDENGAVKFPADRLEDVVRNAKLLLGGRKRTCWPPVEGERLRRGQRRSCRVTTT